MNLRARRFVPSPCSFLDSWRGLDNRGNFTDHRVFSLGKNFQDYPFDGFVAKVLLLSEHLGSELFLVLCTEEELACNQDNKVTYSGLKFNTWLNLNILLFFLQSACLAGFRNTD